MHGVVGVSVVSVGGWVQGVVCVGVVGVGVGGGVQGVVCVCGVYGCNGCGYRCGGCKVWCVWV